MADRSSKRVFISYSRRDRDWLDRLSAHLAPLQQENLIEPWVDSGKIDYGDRYNDEIGRAIDTSRAAVLLVSPHFQSSSFIRENELPRVLRHAESGQLKLYWILVSDCLLADRLGAVYQCANDTKGALDGLAPSEVNGVLARLSRDLQRQASLGPGVVRFRTAAELTTEAFRNSLALPFSSVPGTAVLFSQWLTRVQDYALFAAECPAAGAQWKKAARKLRQQRDHPVVCVTWQQAAAFCAWLTQREGIRYRLPCDAEWTQAVQAVAQNDARFPWGGQWPPPLGAGNYAGEEVRARGVLRIGGYRDGHPMTSPVGSYAANPLGIHDLGGNVWEWCADAGGRSAGRRIVRGASWRDSHLQDLLSSARSLRDPARGYDDTGFRCVAELPS